MVQRGLPLAPRLPVLPEWVEVLGVLPRYRGPFLVPPLLALLQQH